MKRYHYATVDRETFLRASKVPLPGPDAYLAKDEQTEALSSILENGYRFVSLDPASNLAVFEKELPSSSPREIIRSMNQQQVIRDLLAGVEQAIEHAQGKGWRSPDIASVLQKPHSKGKRSKSMKTVEVIVGTTGEIQIDAVGFKGPDCEKATKFLEEVLGVVGKKIKKPEYHRSTRTCSHQKLGG